MNAKMTVRYASGREDHFEIEIYGGGSAKFRFEEFLKDPTLVLRTAGELIFIPAHAIESISLALPESEGEQLPLKNLRRATRVS
jgi:hypothetical protein